MAALWNDKKIKALSGRMMKALGTTGATLDIFLLSDKDMAALKARFFKKRTEPNVLAFPEPAHFPHPELKQRRYLGEIYLNRDILKRSPERAAPLLLHGMLHLLGYDHKRPGDAKRMEGKEAKILERL